MQLGIPFEVHFKDMPADATLIEKVQDRVARLSRTGERILGCQIRIRAMTRNTRHPIYAVHVEAATAHGPIAVSSEHLEEEHADAAVAVRDAMDALHRRIRDRRERRKTRPLHHRGF